MDLMENTVTIKASTNGITVVLDGSKTFDEIKAATAAKFKASASFLGNAKMAITFDGLEMTEGQKSELLKTISDNCELQVTAFYNTKEEMNKTETIKYTQELMKDPYIARFYKGNLRSGQSLDTENSIIILGDIKHSFRYHALLLGTVGQLKLYQSVTYYRRHGRVMRHDSYHSVTYRKDKRYAVSFIEWYFR